MLRRRCTGPPVMFCIGYYTSFHPTCSIMGVSLLHAHFAVDTISHSLPHNIHRYTTFIVHLATLLIHVRHTPYDHIKLQFTSATNMEHICSRCIYSSLLQNSNRAVLFPPAASPFSIFALLTTQFNNNHTVTVCQCHNVQNVITNNCHRHQSPTYA